MPQEGLIAAGGDKKFILFDQFGSGAAESTTEYKFTGGINSGRSCILNTENEIFQLSVHNTEILLNKISLSDSPTGEVIKGCILSGNRMYVLNKSSITVYAKKKAE